MEKINKEELMKKLNLTEKELEKVPGGASTNSYEDCKAECDRKEIAEMNSCDQLYPEEVRTNCINAAFNWHRHCVQQCQPILG